MKKILVVLMSAMLVLSFASCGKSNSVTSDSSNESVLDGEQENSMEPLELLSTVWDSYKEDEKFAVAGGDMSEENTTMNGSGKYDLGDSAALDSALGFPAASIDKIDNAASLIHMMNANTFTCGAYHVINKDDISGVAAAVKENIMNRQWMCGFPDKLVVVSVGDCIVSFFGENEIVDTFKTKLTEAYSDAQIISEDPIS